MLVPLTEAHIHKESDRAIYPSYNLWASDQWPSLIPSSSWVLRINMFQVNRSGSDLDATCYVISSTQAVKSSEQKYKSVLWGPTCDSSDKLLGTYFLPEMHVGEWLLMDNMGAYSVTMCSDFNGFERARCYTVVTESTWSKLNLSQIYDTY